MGEGVKVVGHLFFARKGARMGGEMMGLRREMEEGRPSGGSLRSVLVLAAKKSATCLGRVIGAGRMGGRKLRVEWRRVP
jgi:hypothetical protein